MKPKNCYEVAKGRGFCDYCGDERPELCRYTNTTGAIALIEKLTKEVEELQGLVDSAKTSNPYRFKKDGGTISEVGQWDEGKLERVKFNTPVKILTNQPTWVALGHRIVELEAQVDKLERYHTKALAKWELYQKLAKQLQEQLDHEHKAWELMKADRDLWKSRCNEPYDESVIAENIELQGQLDAVMPYVGHQVDCSYTMFPETQGCDCGYLELVAIKGEG